MTESALFEANLSSLESRGLVSTRTSVALRAAVAAPSRLKFSPGEGWRFEDPAASIHQLLHSRKDPQGEAERQLDAWLASGSGSLAPLVFVFGAAGLFHVKALAARLRPGSRIMVVEPLPEILATALSLVPLQELERSGVELRFASHAEFPWLLEELRFELRRLVCLDIAAFLHPPSARVAPELYKELETAFAEKLRHESANRETMVRFTRQWVLNNLANLPCIASSAPADAFAGLFKGCSGIAIGAGPSLDASIETLKSLKGEFLLVAVGTALKPLLKAGLAPDFVVAVDSDPKTLRQYEGIPLEGVRLAASCNVDPRLPALFPGRASFFSVNLSARLNSWLESNGLLPERLSAGGTVIVSAVDFLRLLGCSRIALCGVDLAMAEGGISHSAGSVYSGRREDGLAPVAGNWGRTVMTTSQFANYVGFVGNFLYDLKRRWPIEVFNANDRGALIANATLIKPDGLSSIPRSALPQEGRARLDALFSQAPRLSGAASSRKAVDESVAWLEDLCAKSRKALLLAKDSPPEAAAFFEAVESSLKDGSPGARLLDSLLNVELSGFLREPDASPVKFHAKVLDAAMVLLAVLKFARPQLPGGPP